MTLALGFLPADLVVLGFRLIVYNSPATMAPFFEYVARTYVGLTAEEVDQYVDIFEERCVGLKSFFKSLKLLGFGVNRGN